MESEMQLINLEFGTKQLSGNVALYKRLLGRFASDYRHTWEKLAEFAQVNNLEEMQMLVHTIKGVSGNLGLDQLHISANAMDSSLKQGNIDTELLKVLNADLLSTLNEIDQLCNQIDESTASKQATFSKSQLIDALNNQRFISDDKLASFLEDCKLSAAAQTQLKTAIDQLDYAAALHILDSE